MAAVANTERTRVLALLERHGWNATSFQTLEPGFRYWFHGDADRNGDSACVAYVDTGRAWVAAGAPIAPLDRLAEVTTHFAAAAAAAGRRVCWFGTETRFHDATSWPALRVGDQPVWSPAEWDGVVAESKSLREQLRRARAKGVTVRRLATAELAAGHPTRTALAALISRWLASRAMAPMGFLVQVDPFSFPAQRRAFVAELDGKIVGFLGVVPIYARGGWFFEDFLRDPGAPNGTVEALVDAGMRAAAAEEVSMVTLGLVPLAGEVGPWLRAARRWGRTLYDFDGLRAFKAKLRPRAWDPIYLAHPPGRSAFLAMLDTLGAFARGGLLRFGVETLLRGPAIVPLVLAALLVPWTILLALPAAAPWFPSPVYQWAWVGFDVALTMALFALGRRWRAALADVVVAAVSCDVVLTLLQAVLYDFPRARDALDVAVIVMAIAAPSLAAVLLWNARAHRAQRV